MNPLSLFRIIFSQVRQRIDYKIHSKWSLGKLNMNQRHSRPHNNAQRRRSEQYEFASRGQRLLQHSTLAAYHAHSFQNRRPGHAGNAAAGAAALRSNGDSCWSAETERVFLSPSTEQWRWIDLSDIVTLFASRHRKFGGGGHHGITAPVHCKKGFVLDSARKCRRVSWISFNERIHTSSIHKKQLILFE